MGTVEAGAPHAAGELRNRPDAWRRSGPALPRMVLGARLHRFRTTRGISRAAAGKMIRASQSKICRMELGRVGFKWRDVADLLTLYQITDETERAALRALASQSNQPGWWQAYADAVPSWQQIYLGLEQAASLIRGYEAQLVPGLLQTADYARAVIQLSHAYAPAQALDRLAELQMRRQQILHAPDGPAVWMVIDEAALRRPIGTMRAQLRHLLQVCESPQVTVQILPFVAGGHAALRGPVTLLRLPDPDLSDVVYLEHLTGAEYPADINHYRDILDHLSMQAAPSTETPAILHQILADT